MKTTLRTDLTVEKLCAGFAYDEREDRTLFGMDGKLTIQPGYQRSSVYAEERKEAAVITSILRGFPLGMIYFNTLIENGEKHFEVLDGRQRLTSIGRFVTRQFPIRDENGEEQFFDTLPDAGRKKILNTSLPVCECEGEATELGAWLKSVNTAGVPPNRQEIRNTVYRGPFVARAMEYFSDPANPELPRWSKFIRGKVRRQDYLESALGWLCSARGISIDRYMSLHRHDREIAELKDHFNAVIDWAERVFITVRKEMRGLKWGRLYETYRDRCYDPPELEREIGWLLADPRVTDRRGVFEYALGGYVEKRLLRIRVFDPIITRYVYREQTRAAKRAGVSNCPVCAAKSDADSARIWDLDEMDADHVSVWSKCELPSLENCQVLCKLHNRAKGNR